MHTTGEPTRIVPASSWPEMAGTLLEQRSLAKSKCDSYRKFIMLEPRGHFDMYGALLRPHTELTATGAAHIGVLFMHNEGYSTMCGHASIALGRYLVDTHDLEIFPKRNELQIDASTMTIRINLHAPCGVVAVTVPVTADGQHADVKRPVSFISVPSWASAPRVKVPIDITKRWPELEQRKEVEMGIAYGGAFYCIVTAKELGFESGLRRPDLRALEFAAKNVQDAVNAHPDLKDKIAHPVDDDLSFLYSVMIIDADVGSVQRAQENQRGELGLCFFADSQIDRSPTGSCVAAREALACARNERPWQEKYVYESFVSNGYGRGSFIGSAIEICDITDRRGRKVVNGVKVRVEGYAYYTGSHTFIMEEDDFIEDGFTMQSIARINTTK